MFGGKQILGVILARGGSKGIPRKNIKLLNSKPLIAYTIKEAKKSKYIDRIILSTEDEEIASVARRYGAEVPFMRPEKLATDEATSMEAIIHAVKWLEKNEKYKPDYVALLQPTSPLRTVKNIDESIQKIIKEAGDSLVSLCKVDKHPYWMMEIKEQRVISFNSRKKEYTRRQDLPDIYNINGAIYLVKTKLLLEERSFQAGETIPYIMAKERSIDIDDTLDWKLAELLLKEEQE